MLNLTHLLQQLDFLQSIADTLRTSLLWLGHRWGYAAVGALEGLALAGGLAAVGAGPRVRWGGGLLLFQLEWWAGLLGYLSEDWRLRDQHHASFGAPLGEGLALEGSLGPALLLLGLLFGLYRLLLPLPAAEGRWLTLLCALQLLLSGSRDFLTFYLLLETANMVLYSLMAGRWVAGRTAGVGVSGPPLKLQTLLAYFLLNLLGSTLLLLGFGFVYLSVGSLSFGEVSLLLSCSSAGLTLIAGHGLTLGLLTVLGALLLKLGLAPFHFWVAPIYQALPPFLFVYLMLFPKGGLLLLLLQWGPSLGLNGNQPALQWTLLLVASLNLVWGTLGALNQTNLRRLLIYSSLANLSLVFYALAVGGAGVSASGTQYLLLYLLTSGTLLLPLGAISEAGLLRRWSLPEFGRGCHPRLRVLLSMGLLNLSGVPPFGLFFGKVPVALELAERGFYGSLGLLLLFSVAAAAYAFGLLVALWHQGLPLEGTPPTLSTPEVCRELSHQLLLSFGVVAATELLENLPPHRDSGGDWERAAVPLADCVPLWVVELSPRGFWCPTALGLQLAVQPYLLALLLLTLLGWGLGYREEAEAPASGSAGGGTRPGPFRGLGPAPTAASAANAVTAVKPDLSGAPAAPDMCATLVREFNGEGVLDSDMMLELFHGNPTAALAVDRCGVTELYNQWLERSLPQASPEVQQLYAAADGSVTAPAEEVAPGVIPSVPECIDFATELTRATLVRWNLLYRFGDGMGFWAEAHYRCLSGFAPSTAVPPQLSAENMVLATGVPGGEPPMQPHLKLAKIMNERSACRNLAEKLWLRSPDAVAGAGEEERNRWLETVTNRLLRGLNGPEWHLLDQMPEDKPSPQLWVYWDEFESYWLEHTYRENYGIIPELKRQAENWDTVVQLLTERLDMLSMGQRRLLTAAKGDLLKLTRSQDQAAYLRQLIDKLLRAQQEYSDHHRALLEHHFGKAVADAAMADWENLGRSWIWLTDSLEEGILGSSAWAVPDHWDRALRQPWPTPSAAEELPTLLVAGALVVTLLGVLAAAARLLGRSGGRSGGGDRAAAAAYECGFAPYAALSSSSLLLFYRLAVFFVVFEAELIFLFPWAASLTATAEAGNPGPFLAPLGFIGLLFYGYGRELRANALKL